MAGAAAAQIAMAPSARRVTSIMVRMPATGRYFLFPPLRLSGFWEM